MRGRPVLKPKFIGVRVTDYQFDELERYSRLLNVSKTNIIQSAIAIYLNQLSSNPNIQNKIGV